MYGTSSTEYTPDTEQIYGIGLPFSCQGGRSCPVQLQALCCVGQWGASVVWLGVLINSGVLGYGLWLCVMVVVKFMGYGFWGKKG